MKRALGSQRLRAAVIVIVIVTECNCNSSANKSNHPIQNPLLFDTEPRTRDSMYTPSTVGTNASHRQLVT
jgi:hypothetical protein